jgi:hypothetical protein
MLGQLGNSNGQQGTFKTYDVPPGVNEIELSFTLHEITSSAVTVKLALESTELPCPSETLKLILTLPLLLASGVTPEFHLA